MRVSTPAHRCRRGPLLLDIVVGALRPVDAEWCAGGHSAVPRDSGEGSAEHWISGRSMVAGETISRFNGVLESHSLAAQDATWVEDTVTYVRKRISSTIWDRSKPATEALFEVEVGPSLRALMTLLEPLTADLPPDQVSGLARSLLGVILRQTRVALRYGAS